MPWTPQQLNVIDAVKITGGVACTIGLYSILYKETKLFRFFEHVFLGLAAGYMVVAMYKESLYPQWIQRMTGQMDDAGNVTQPAMFLYVVLLPIGLLGYTVFSRKHNWMSRIPIGIILGLWAGQQLLNYWDTASPGIYSSMQPIIPTTWSSFVEPDKFGLTPDQIKALNQQIYPSQAINNLIFVIAILSSLSYFIYSFDTKNRAMSTFNRIGRWTLMIGFGAIFGSTVMARFALVIDRMYYIWVEWIQALQKAFGQ